MCLKILQGCTATLSTALRQRPADVCVTVSEHLPELFVGPVESPGVLKASLSGHLPLHII